MQFICCNEQLVDYNKRIKCADQRKCLCKIKGKTNKPNYHDGYGPAKLGHSWKYENYKIYIYNN